MRDSPLFPQADLLVQVLPFVHAQECFALKGGTSINFFVRDFSRMSVDIDLVYLPLEDRPATLRGIDAALKCIAAKLPRTLPGLKVREIRLPSDKLWVKLAVRTSGGAEITIEPNTVLRGVLHPGLPGVELLPGPQWKLYNLRRMDPAKRKVAEERLRQTLGF